MAVLCRAMHKYTDITVIGICHGVQGGIYHAALLLGVSPEDLECRWIGTNHYYWFTSVTCGGIDRYPELMRRVGEHRDEEGHALAARLSGIYGYQIVYPEDDHIIEFYPFAAQTRGGQFSTPYGLGEKARVFGYDESLPALSEVLATSEVRSSFFDQYRKLVEEVQLPEEPDSSITGEGIGALISAISTGRRRVFIVNIANRSCIPNLPETAEVEVEAVSDSQGVRPVYMGEAPIMLKGILEKRFAWQELVADAAVTGDRNRALQALMLDEMAIWPEQSEAMLDELLEASRHLLPQFF
jgi:alpha-galactosidase